MTLSLAIAPFLGAPRLEICLQCVSVEIGDESTTWIRTIPYIPWPLVTSAKRQDQLLHPDHWRGLKTITGTLLPCRLYTRASKFAGDARAKNSRGVFNTSEASSSEMPRTSNASILLATCTLSYFM